MDGEFKNWLQDSKVAQKTLDVLEKEELISAKKISLLKEMDLEFLRTQHSLTMGQIIELREARDALLRGEFIPDQPNQQSNENERTPQRETKDETDSATLPPGDETSHTHRPEAVDVLQNRLKEAEEFRKQGHTDRASEYTQEVVEGARDHVDGIIAQALPEHLSDKLGTIADATNTFKTGGHSSSYLCCCLL